MKKIVWSIAIIMITLLAMGSSICSAQNGEFKNKSLKTGIGFGVNEGQREQGVGIIYSIGLQKTVGKKQRLRLNPNLKIGGFVPFLITDVPDQFYRITTLGYNFHYDILKYKQASIVVSAGPFLSYSRGLLGRGGEDNYLEYYSGFFNSFYFGGDFSMGFRIDSPKKRVAYETKFIAGQVGNNYFVLPYIMFGMDFKSRK